MRKKLSAAVLVTACVAPLASYPVRAASADQQHITGTVVNIDGSAQPGATIDVASVDSYLHKSTILATTKSGPGGKFDAVLNTVPHVTKLNVIGTWNGGAVKGATAPGTESTTLTGSDSVGLADIDLGSTDATGPVTLRLHVPSGRYSVHPDQVGAFYQDDGEYRMHAAPGHYNVQTYQPGAPDQAPVDIVTVKNGATTTVNFQTSRPTANNAQALKREGFQLPTASKETDGKLVGETFGGIVVDTEGAPVPEAEVAVFGAAGMHTSTDLRGRFLLFGITVKHPYIQATAPGVVGGAQVFGTAAVVVIKVRNRIDLMDAGDRFAALLKSDDSNHGDGSDAQGLLNTAEKQAASGRKRVLIDFHTTWCGPAFMMHRFLNDPEVRPVLTRHFVIRELDIWEREHSAWENPHGTELYAKCGGTNSVPYCVVVDPAGRKLGATAIDGENIGMPDDPVTRQAFLAMLKKAAPSLTKGDLDILRNGLTAQPAIRR